MPQTFTRLFFHVVFSTKHRAALIQPAWEDDLYADIGGIVRNRKAELVIGGGTENHVHLLIRWPTTVCVADMVRDIKTNSSLWRHQSGDAGFTWQTGYGCFTVSPSMLDVVGQYIAHQKEHHETQSFQDEFRELVLAHGLELDEAHMWE
jgi:REP element-mobilizing transposase RayT